MNISKLNELLNSSKLNKVQVAERCSISRTTLDNVLQGADAKISTIESLARVFKVPVGYFFDDNGNNAVANGNSSVAAVNSNISVGDVAVLKERVSSLEQLLAEKERLIKVLMKK